MVRVDLLTVGKMTFESCMYHVMQTWNCCSMLFSRSHHF